ncbi:MAG TPA: penicillin acylase family protein [Chitinophagaceae bacterium]|nr:penicillin acylase family protein [Chitinophagaceae bacterium]
MKKFFLLFVLVLIVYCLNRNWSGMPGLGKFLDPYHGCWQNAKSETEPKVIYSMKPLLKPVEVRFDDRLVPHVFAKNSHDLIFIQGFLHAKFRLWQMDMTTRLASGRLSEIVGSKTLSIDREMRRKGMVYGAENSLKTMEADQESKQTLEAYCDGVNYFIQSLRYKSYPLEYKLMGFEPELWTNLKTSLMIKFMADKLSGRTQDFELTLARKILGDQFNILYPEHLDEEYPVIPENDNIIGTHSNDKIDLKNIEEISFKSKNFNRVKTQDNIKEMTSSNNIESHNEPKNGIGSNNWALDGTKTQSGKPILCNDPHLPLNLPAIWYENQLVSPDLNVYGVSLPGAPQVVIGFNDSIAWGFTNGYRDVKDFYTIQFKDKSKKEYFFDGQYLPSKLKIESIKIKGENDFLDTVAYTKLGIVMYDDSYPKKGFEGQNFAMNWMAHKGSDELKALTNLNRSKNYNEYINSIKYFHCPHQNIVFASASGDIAMWSQGLFANKKQGQGRFVEEINHTDQLWTNMLSVENNPHELNPKRGFVMSANQVNTSHNDPIYYNGIFSEERAKRITNMLSEKKKFNVQDMMIMQNDKYWQNASEILPLILSYSNLYDLNKTSNTILQELKTWNYVATTESRAAIMYDIWFNILERKIYDDEFGKYLPSLNYPNERVTLQLLQSKNESIIFDNILTTQRETKANIILQSFSEMVTEYEKVKHKTWYQYKNTSAEHLSKIPAFSVPTIKIGGGHGIVNAASAKDGPSWRMIVHFTNPIEAYGIYPGGESGNIASPHYINMIDDWANGKYYRLNFAHQPNDIP